VPNVSITGVEFKRAGVLFLNLVPVTQRQMSLFDPCDRDQDERLMQAIDQLNQRFGASTVKFGATGLEQPWQMKAAQLSRRYTTRWEECATGLGSPTSKKYSKKLYFYIKEDNLQNNSA